MMDWLAGWPIWIVAAGAGVLVSLVSFWLTRPQGVASGAQGMVAASFAAPAEVPVAAEAPAAAKEPVVAEAAIVEGPYGPGSALPNADGSGPQGWTIKGNADSMLYHTVDSPYYERTKAEAWFREESAAEAAGFARWDTSRVPA